MNSTYAQLQASSDDSFGPQVTVLVRDFDFTLLFEQSILTVGPVALSLLIFPIRLRQLYNASVKGRRGRLLLLKLV